MIKLTEKTYTKLVYSVISPVSLQCVLITTKTQIAFKAEFEKMYILYSNLLLLPRSKD